MNYSDHIRVVAYAGRVGIFNVANSREYVLITADRNAGLEAAIRSDLQVGDRLLQKMKDERWIIPDEEESRPLNLRPEVPTGIDHILIELTDRCNLHCRYCYRDADASTSAPEIGWEDFRKLVLPFLVRQATKIVGLVGGEPTVATDFLPILNLILARTEAKLTIYTNGVCFPENLLFLISRHGSRIQLQVSMDGATEQTHARVRGPGAFEAVRETLQRLRRSGTSNVVVKMTLTPENSHEHKEFYKAIRGMGFTPATSLFRSSGRGGYCPFSYREVCAAIDSEMLEAIGPGRRGAPTIEDFRKSNIFFSLYPCGLGFKRSAVIDAECNLLDCTAIRRNLGSLRTDSGKAFNEYARMEFPSVESIPGCRECEVRYVCKGGCRAYSYQEEGTLLGGNPYCDVMRKLMRNFIWGG
jgi:radical SAM protein with 4Fe4S-binding SPASM domain